MNQASINGKKELLNNSPINGDELKSKLPTRGTRVDPMTLGKLGVEASELSLAYLISLKWTTVAILSTLVLQEMMTKT